MNFRFQILDFRLEQRRVKKQESGFQICNLKSRGGIDRRAVCRHITSSRGRERPFVTTSLELVGDEVGEKVGENSEQCQPRQTISREHPGSAAFPLNRGGCGRGLLGRRNDRGPIFHAKPPKERSWRKYIMRHACLASGGGRTI